MEVDNNQLVNGKCVAMMIAIGADVMGGEVYGELEHLIYDNGEWRTLDYWYPKSSAPLMSAGNPEVLTRRQLKPQAEPSVSPKRVGKSTTINLDYAKFSAHPKATGK
jgi:hypothetical protein